MSFVDVIARKRDGHALSREDIEGFIAGVTSGEVPDYQASALLMAIVLRGMSAEADALVISCLNTRSHTVITALEQAFGKPVITSTQATLWHALRLAGIQDPIPGIGRIFAAH